MKPIYRYISVVLVAFVLLSFGLVGVHLNERKFGSFFYAPPIAAAAPNLVATTISFGNASITPLGTDCTSTVTTVTGATTSMVAEADPVTYPGDGAVYFAYVSGANTVTTKVCSILALTPTASIYNIRVLP